MLKKHPDYQVELSYLRMTIDEIIKTLNIFQDRFAKIKKDTTQLLKHFKHNPDEGSQTYIEIMTNMEFIKFYEEKIKGLTRSKDKPYFARIDFIPDNNRIKEVCYIGKTGLTREPDNEIIIVDWRAPIANLYYEGRLGKSSYKVPLNTSYEEIIITGELSLKRQFTIEKGELLEIFDIDVTTTDPLLQKALGANADNRLKDIAATIQAEQNRIIRSDIKTPLIVQGVAGSGKTTIALHRIAYLIYTYESTFNPDTYMIIAPNRLFLNYISEVLPELGVEYVKQTTFVDFILEYLGTRFKIENPNHKLINLLNEDSVNKKTNRLMLLSSRFKGSLFFKKVIDKYINDIEENFIPRKDLDLNDLTLITSSEIRSIFLSEYKYYPIYKRLAKLKKRLKRTVKKKIEELIAREEARTDKIIEIFSQKSTVTDDDREYILKVVKERDQKIERFKMATKTLVDNYLAKTQSLKLLDYYTDLIGNPDTLNLYSGGHFPDELLHFIADRWNSRKDSKLIEIEDLAPLTYLKYRLYGHEKPMKLNHVVIDEAQDFSMFQFYIIKKLANTDSFTIMGDLAQGIHSYRAINNWDEVIKGIFPKTGALYTTLEQSYRTTIEIMNLANEIIKHFTSEKSEAILARPIIRHGNLPTVTREKPLFKLINYITSEIKKLTTAGHKSIALICKNMDECLKLYKSFPDNCKPDLITEDLTEYNSGVMIIPSYLAKGLEFDCVFIITIDTIYEQKDLDIKLLYISMTRALHNLYLCSVNALSPMFNLVDSNLYQTIEL